MIIHFEKNEEQFEGEISEDVYYSKIFPIFRDYLIPIEQKKFYTMEQALEKLIRKDINTNTNPTQADKLLKLGIITIICLSMITAPVLSYYFYERELALNKNDCISNADVWVKNYDSKDYSCTVQDQDSISYGSEYNFVKFNETWELLK